MTAKPPTDFNKFKDFVRKIVTVPKSEIDAIKEELKEKKKKAKKQSTKPKA